METDSAFKRRNGKDAALMRRKSTEELNVDLCRAPSLRDFLKDNEEDFTTADFSSLLNEEFLRSGLSKATLAKNSGMSEIYLHQLFAGKRRPSRDRLIALCIGLSESIDGTQELLRQSGLAQLYVRKKRDAVILYGLLHGLNLYQVNDLLFDCGEETLV